MMKTKFQENFNLISQSNQEFENFLNQIKSNTARPQNIIKQQTKNENDYFLKKSLQKSRMFENDINPQRFYQKKSESKINFRKNENEEERQKSIKDDSNEFKFAARNLFKMNPSSSQFFQQDKITKQSSSQLIELKSGKEFPSWLFEHIRKKNVSKLKNVNLKEYQAKQSQIIGRDQSQSKDRFEENKKTFHQRHLNESYRPKSDRAQMVSQNYISQAIPNQTKLRKSMNQIGQMRKMSSSFEIKNSNHQRSIMRKTNKIQKMLINDYEYSYCPENQQEQICNINKVNNKNHRFDRQAKIKSYHSSQKSKQNQYRIRQEDRLRNVHHLPKFLTKRLPTVSEEQPLNQPRKFEIC